MKKMILWVGAGLVGFLVLMGAIVGTVYFVVKQTVPAMTAARPSGGDSDEPAVNLTKDNKVTLKPFVTNLADTENRVYISVTFELVLRNDKDKEKVDNSVPLVRDTIVSALNSKKAQEVTSDPGYNSLKNDLQSRLNSVLGGKLIQKVLVTDLVVQY